MASRNLNVRPAYRSTHRLPNQRELFALIFSLGAQRRKLSETPLLRIVVDSRFNWSVKPINDQHACVYLEQRVRVRQVAD